MIKAAKFERVAKYPDAILPTRATTGSAGYDFYCAEDTVVPSLPRDLAHIWKVGFGPEVSIEEIVKKLICVIGEKEMENFYFHSNLIGLIQSISKYSSFDLVTT